MQIKSVHSSFFVRLTDRPTGRKYDSYKVPNFQGIMNVFVTINTRHIAKTGLVKDHGTNDTVHGHYVKVKVIRSSPFQ